MIDEEKTFKLFKYYSTDLKPKSSNKVIAICDGCKRERIIRKDSYRKFCRSCSKIGKKHSKETKEKMSKSRSGKNNSMYGKNHSQETKNKISKANSGENGPCFGRTGDKHPMFGKHLSEETKRKISKNNLRLSGKNHPNWKGGISFIPYCLKFNNKLRGYIRERDNNTCQLCGKSQNENKRKLTVHHIHYDKENCNPDLITLCISCNSKVNYNRDYWEQYFIRLLVYNKHTEIYNMESELNIWNYGNF